jgi:hypothetical protein
LRRAAEAQAAQARDAVGRIAEGRAPATASSLPLRALVPAAVAAFRECQGLAERKALLNLVLQAPVELLPEAVAEPCREPWAQERAALVLTLRFGTPYAGDWTQWTAWLAIRKAAATDRRPPLPGTSEERFLLWYAGRPEADPSVVEALETRCARAAPPVSADEVLERWPVAPALPPPAEAPPPRPPSPAAGKPTTPPLLRAPRRPPPPPVEPPSAWREHVQGFLAENAYVVAGIVMVVVGASLLAYFTWDKHWLLRYTIMPGLLFAFTGALGTAAAWLEGRDSSLRDTGAALRAAAVLLLPVNFMALALLAGDPGVANKTLAVPAMAIVYFGLGGASLFHACRGVEARLRAFLPLVLLALNALVLLRPASAGFADGTFRLVAGFHAGFLAAAWAVVRFVRRVLDGSMARDRRVPAFVGVALVATFLEVFVLLHAGAAPRPPLHAYAALPVLAGGLVLFVERRFLALRGGRLGAESFLGYALVLLGILMGSGEAGMRIATLLLAGIVWLLQAGQRGEVLHHWIGMTLLVLAGASVGLLPGFPGPRLPVLGLALGVAVGLAGTAAGGRARGQLREACRGLQPTVLVLSTVVAVLAQWRYRSDPLATAGTILSIAALLAWRAGRDRSLPLVHTAAAHLALALPYLGFVDIGQRTLRGNTMPIGLAILAWAWIGLLAARPGRLLRDARSTVLLLYGVLALAAMTLRVIVEGRLTAEASLALAYPDHLGPLLMAAALVCATWWSRSLLPAAIASILLVILFPALKADLQASFPALGWGTGFGSALSALCFVLLGFRLRAAPTLRRLEGGDLLLGETPFPFRRPDHTLFTAPLLASAVFLLARVDTWTLAQHLDEGVPFKTAAALVLTSASWILLAAYWRTSAGAGLLVHAGWVTLFLGVWFGYGALVSQPQAQWPIAITLLVLQALDLSLRGLPAPRYSWVTEVLADPLRGVARTSSLLLSLAVVVGLLGGTPLERVEALALVVGLQLVRTALGERSVGTGSCLVGLAYVVLLAAAAPGPGPLADRLSVDAGSKETLWLVVLVQLAQMLLEVAPGAYQASRPVLLPAQVLATGLALALGVYGLADPFTGATMSAGLQVLLLLAVLLTARAHGSGPLAVLFAALLYLFIHAEPVRALPRGEARVAYVLEPLRSAVWAFLAAVAAVAGRALARRAPGVLSGRRPFAFLAGPGQSWLHAAAIVVSLVAALRHTAVAELRHAAVQLPAPWLAAATAVIVGWFSGPYLLFWVAVGLASMGNVHAVRLFWGEPLRGGGVSEVHLAALGLGLTLLEGSVLRLVWRHEAVRAFVNRASLAVAGLVLTLLTTNYATHPDLAAMTPTRFVVSGAMALAAGLYFRRAARRPGPGEQPHVDLCEGLYHFGLASAAWCAALLVPWFRQPSTVLLALALPAAGFWARAELEAGETGRRFRTSSAVLGFLLLGLYALRPVFQMVLFPETAIETDHYHYYAGLAMAVGLLLLRLHGLGGTTWLAFYGGLALVAGSYFALTAWPGLSPFSPDGVVPAAWCAVGLAHFWTVATAQRSPLRSFLKRLAALDAPAWLDLRASWGRFLLAASQAVVLLGALQAASADTYAVAPLLVGGASVFVHHAVLYSSPWRGKAGVILLALALHADFALPSYLRRDDVVSALLLIWAALLLVPGLLGRPLRSALLGAAAGWLAALTLVQVLHHHPSSDAGLLAVALGAVLAALTPRETASPVSPEERLSGALLLAVPAWLVYFSQAPLLDLGPRGAFETRAVLLTSFAVFATGLFARSVAPTWERSLLGRAAMVLHHAVALAARTGPSLHAATMALALAGAVLLQAARYERPLPAFDLLLFLALYASLAVAFYREGQRARMSLPYFAAEACLLLAFAVVRRQAMLAAAGWTYEYDVWTSLGVSLLLAGSKQAFDERPRELRVPFVFSVLALPVFALAWTQVHHLGVDVALLVVGLHGLMFAYLGRDRAGSLYNLVATAGFVAFVLMVFWTKLELRVLHAYVIPVGLGVLVLLQLFGRELPAETRNRVRLLTLLAMLGSASYYALVDDRHPMAFNLTLLLLCLASMALGSVLRIRLYLVLGLAAVLVDLASIVVKVLVRLDRGERMTSVGLLVLLIGGALVSGAVYYKTHHDEIDAQVTRWRRRLGAWE